MEKKKGALIWSYDFNSYWVDLVQRMKLNTLGLHPIPGVEASDCRSVETFLENLKTDAFRENIRILQEKGITVEFEMHAMHLLMPHEQFNIHPEWFRMDEVGLRCCDFNFCPSNEDALHFVEERAAWLAEQFLPFNHNHRYYIWTDDNGQYCHCEHCRELSPSDQALIIYNHILKGIRTVDPQATQSYLAYQSTLRVPRKVKPEEGIFLEYAPINRDSCFAMDDEGCRNNINEGVHIEPLMNFFGKKGSQVLEYWVDNSRFYHWKHPFGELPYYPGVLHRDLKYYEDAGFENYTSFACGVNEKYAEQYGELAILDYGSQLSQL